MLVNLFGLDTFSTKGSKNSPSFFFTTRAIYLGHIEDNWFHIFEAMVVMFPRMP